MEQVSTLRVPTHRSWHLTAIFAVLGLITMLLSPVIALADDIDASYGIESNVTNINLNVGQDATGITYFVVERSGDGKNGCNLTGATTLVVNVGSDNTNVARVQNSTGTTSRTFESCGDQETVSVTAVGPGLATISLSLVSNSTAGTFSLSPATFTVNVAAPANNTPVVAVTGFANGDTFESGFDTLPTVGCSVTDDQTVTAVPAPQINDQRDANGLGTYTATCSYTDSGGKTGSDERSFTVIDTTAPGIVLLSRTAANANGWNNGDVTVTWTCTDAGSGPASATVNKTASGEGANQSLTGTCTDRAGLTASDTQGGINIDLTKPTLTFDGFDPAFTGDWSVANPTKLRWTCSDALSGVNPDDVAVSDSATNEGFEANPFTKNCVDLAGNKSLDDSRTVSIDSRKPSITASAAPAPNAAGWNKTNVTVSFECSDPTPGSGIATGACPASVPVDQETTTSGQNVSDTVFDVAGNESLVSNVVNVKLDKTLPTVEINGITDGASFYFGSVPAAAGITCASSDALSGLDGTCALTGYSTALGTHTLTATAKDNAGNSRTTTVSYTVDQWTLKGFYQPVDMSTTNPPVYNTVKGGSTVPLKFEIFAGPTELTSTSAVKTFTAPQVDCASGATVDDIELTSTGGTSLRYDTTGGQFVQNWQTPKGLVGSCYKVTMTAQDGSPLVAYFKLK